MKQIALSTVAALVIALSIGAPAHADNCYADYKAKRDNPLKLHYGVMQVRGACSNSEAANDIRNRLAGDKWILLNVLSVFDDAGLAERKNRAGKFYLRF